MRSTQVLPETWREELLPYVCVTDFTVYENIKNVGFMRTQTLAGGAASCDFRLIKGGKNPQG